LRVVAVNTVEIGVNEGVVSDVEMAWEKSEISPARISQLADEVLSRVKMTSPPQGASLLARALIFSSRWIPRADGAGLFGSLQSVRSIGIIIH
jgi:hypothetical protein